MAISPGLGVGFAPFLSAYGYGTPAQAPVPGGKVYRDARGRQQNCAALLAPMMPGSQTYLLGPSSPKFQYFYDEFGRKIGAPDVVHMATLALGTIEGTAIDPTLGHTFRDIRKVLESFESDMRTKVVGALSNLVQRSLIRIDSVKSTPGNGAPAFTKVMLTDLTTQEPIELGL